MTKDEIGDLIEALPQGLDTDEFIYRLVNWAVDIEREKVAQWIIERGFATGHGDSIEDLLKELDWQVTEREREACAKVCEQLGMATNGMTERNYECAQAIRERGEK